MRGIVDERGQPAFSRLFFLRTHDPVDCHATIRGWLIVEELPRPLVSAESLLLGGRERPRSVFISVNTRFLFATLFECLCPCRPHQAGSCQLRRTADVDPAPDAAASPRRESDAVTQLVDPSSHSVDPAKAERLIDRFRPGDRWPPGVSLVEAHQKLGCLVVILLEPLAERG